ncbi:MFS transporter [Streptomyces lanatus]|uniref:MFS transporter n=1 Tax=Streptomyces lanatus TaxID=66900 RepID=A0ABV1Y4G8_9ACTN|nr:MFS transporter [Streptomyces lanatus]GHH27694.1 MFS transporter [Streptomyces lanatus]
MSALAQEPAPAAIRPGTLPLLLFASTLTVMAGSILAPVIQVIRGDLGVGGTAGGLIITTHSLAIAVTSPLAGWMLDRWGVRLPLAGGLVLYGVAGGAGLLVDSYPALIATRAVFGAGAALVFSGTTVALLNMYRGPAQDRAMGWRGTATSLGGVLWPLLAGAIGGISWHLPFGIYLVGVPLGIATALMLPRTAPASSGRAGGPAPGVWAMLREHRLLLVWYALQFCGSLLLYVLVVFLPQRLAEVGVEDPLLVSFYTVGMSAAMSLIGLAYASMRARLAYSVLLRGSLSLWVAGFLLLAVAPNAPLLFLAPLLFGLGQGVFFPVTTVLVGEGVPAEIRGKATSLSGTATFAGQFASPLLIGPLIQATSAITGFLVAATVPAVAVILLVLSRADTTDSPSDEPAPAAARVK